MRSIKRNPKRLALLVPFLLIFVVVAIPLNHSALEQVGVTYSYSPAGPADLHVTLSHGPYRFDPKDVLFMTLRAIGRQFLAGDWDWNSRLLERDEYWAGPPGIQLFDPIGRVSVPRAPFRCLGSCQDHGLHGPEWSLRRDCR